MSVGELVTIGSKIAEIGEELKMLRAERDEINIKISAHEKELMPLVTQHAKIIAELIGAPVPAPVQTPPVALSLPGTLPMLPSVSQNGPNGPTLGEAKTRIADFLKSAEPGISATEIAQALRLEPFLVRQVMGEFARGGS